MDRGQLQAFSKATLLGLVLLSAATWVPQGFSYLRGFLSVSLPSAASAIVTPKQCFFVFCNIIVVFLATESKLSRKGARSRPIGEDDDLDVAVRKLAIFAPSVKENHAAAGDIVQEGERGDVCMTTQQQLDQCEKEEDASSTTTTLGEDEVLLEEVMRKEEDCEEEATGLPTVDELNRRVEDFIARFNMERQLELEAARMLVCF